MTAYLQTLLAIVAVVNIGLLAFIFVLWRHFKKEASAVEHDFQDAGFYDSTYVDEAGNRPFRLLCTDCGGSGRNLSQSGKFGHECKTCAGGGVQL